MDRLSGELAWLTLLAALWGGSFLFMRVAAPVFGPLPLIHVVMGGQLGSQLHPVRLWPFLGRAAAGRGGGAQDEPAGGGRLAWQRLR
ncbi:hypothetical protein ABI908_14930, partial [Chromobacterium phragmitis]